MSNLEGVIFGLIVAFLVGIMIVFWDYNNLYPFDLHI